MKSPGLHIVTSLDAELLHLGVQRGPLQAQAGAVIGHWGYASVFLFSLIAVIAALGITVVLRAMRQAAEAAPGSIHSSEIS